MATGDQLSPAQARVVDPVQSAVARGYRSAMHVWPDLFPVVTVSTRGGTVIEFGTEHLAKIELRRAPGANIPELDFGYSGQKYTLENRGLSGKVPVETMEEAAAVPGIDMASVAVMRTMEAISLQIEVEAAALANAAANHGGTTAVAANDRWDAANSQPAKAVQKAKAAIRLKIGMDPNTLVVGGEVYDALVNNADVVDRIKHTMPAVGDSIDEAVLARYFRVERFRAAAAVTGTAGSFAHLWGKIAILCYSNVTSLRDRGSPSWGYTYRLSGYPLTEMPYYRRENRSWLYPCHTEDTPVVAGKDASHLFTTVIG